MMLQLVLVCCVVRWAAADDTLFFVPHNMLSKNMSCPDNTQCPVGNTCCPTQDSNQFGCCPYNNAVCCSDGVHCCQKGTECRSDGGGCVHPDGVADQSPKEVKTLTAKSILCPDHQGMCPTGQSCCEGRNGEYACCKFDGGVCCSDKIHCCPAGLTCDLQAGRCVKKGIRYLLTTLFNRPLSRTSPVVRPDQGVKCSDGSTCPDRSTCCKMVTGSVGCCPLPKHISLKNKISTSLGKSSKDPSFEAVSIKKASPDVLLGDRLLGEVSCNSSFSCPSGSSCCQMTTGQWWCCSYADAFCCSDGMHCCPSGTVRCDIPEKKCDYQDGSSVPWVTKVAAIVRDPVKCDNGHDCPDESKDNSLDKADTAIKESSLDISLGGGSIGRASPDVLLGDGLLGEVSCNSSFSCPSGYSCCQMTTGQWWCCSYADAFCCSDGMHCCPSGTVRCDIPEKKCDYQDGSSVPWVTKVAAIVRDLVKCDNGHDCPDGSKDNSLDKVNTAIKESFLDISLGGGSVGKDSQDVLLGDGLLGEVSCNSSFSCQSGYSCCQMTTGQWWCCSYADAFCCADGMHCCPSGTIRCDIPEKKCDYQDGSSVPWVTKVAAIVRDPVKCDNGHDCPDGSKDNSLDKADNAIKESFLDISLGGGSVGKASPDVLLGDGLLGEVSCNSSFSCPSGYSCCQMTTGQWWCCSYPDAFCCADGMHCCPSGTVRCDIPEKKCDYQDGSSVPWVTKVAAIVRDPVKCDNEHRCPDGNTCCRRSSGQWGCCALLKAVCCSDGEHCCPSGSKCDLAKGTCDSQDGSSTSWFEKTSAIRRKEESVVCPGGTSQCPDGNTCCKLSTGQWGCCPLPQAVCCSDGTHCCPSGTTCDVSSGKCNRQDGSSTSWFEKTSAVSTKEESVVCPGGTSQCPDGNTCCKLSTGQWGCCPLPQAVCCSDGTHCCPSGTTCAVSTGRCSRQDGTSVSWFEKTSAVRTKEESVVCPGGTSQCPDGNTCCKLSTGQWGCCPLPQAVCCSDGTHCCPSGTTCDVSSGKCNRQDGSSVSWFEKTLAINKKVENVICPGGTSQCPDGNTCCKLSTGQWGCCPLSQAVCCSDGTHCCPSGTTCDTTSSRCIRQDGSSVTWFKKTPAIKKDVENVICPGGTSECPDGNTCCKESTGQYGCCPMPKAVCCSDQVHCCPSGTTCDVSAGKCNRGDGSSVEWLEKSKAVNAERGIQIIDSYADSMKNRPEKPSHVDMIEEQTVTCPGEGVVCPGGSTCCKLLNNNWGCCPYGKATCCSDGVHCCPGGMTCNEDEGTCSKDGLSFTWSDKRPARAKVTHKEDLSTEGTDPVEVDLDLKTVGNVKCNAQSSCPDNQTCCPTSGSNFGCCPLPKGVCCPDHVHCCPMNTECSMAHRSCLVKGTMIPWLERVREPLKTPSKPYAVMCPDGRSECPDGSTCCMLSSGTYGCCPLPDAVCCTDGVHCCPHDTTCDVAHGKCQQLEVSLSLVTTSTPVSNVNMVRCSDGKSECPDGNTCCKLPTGQYGCCPMPKAVCCSDGVHCCPSGTTCEVSTGRCKREDGYSVSWFEKTSAINKKEESVVCPGGTSQCPDGNTCCKLPTGQWGCCPLPQAVCCSDGTHCCPSGTTCDVSTGKCNRQDGTLITWFKKTPAINRKVENVICPGGTSECPDGNTCCKLSTGQFGCCPLPKAVCCSDGTHCCPSGTTCDVSTGRCSRQDGTSVSWFKKTAAINRKEESVVCPGGTSQCPDGNTCCKLSTGQWGCCPLPQAVCCSDGTHCCPSGTTCQVSTGKCSRQDGSSTSWLEKTSAVEKLSANENQLSVHENGRFVCNGTTKKCNTGQTCCPGVDGHYGCCVFSNGVCCSDGTHCCPSGTMCDVESGHCLKKGRVLSSSINLQEGHQEDLKDVQIVKDVQMIKCPDGTRECPDGNTCCRASTGLYECCPLPRAVCCSDGNHCCPSGTTCDVSEGKCNRQDGTSLFWFKKTTAISKKVEMVKCDETHKCPDGNTCCKLSTGQWGCCPLPNAVCCSDGTHCCPSGTTCDVSSGKCNRQDGLTMKWFKKTTSMSKKVEMVKCDQTHECPDGNTCCKLSSGQWGCCPLPQAVCCSDGTHCCPSGTTCDVSSGKCNRQDGSSTSWFEKTSAVSTKEENVVCPGGTSHCPDGSTCCKLSSGQYGCCPIPKAVCCSDGVHCCPSGTTCDLTQGTCSREDGSVVTWLKKTVADTIKPEVELKDITCGDGSTCPNGSSCCKVSSGSYGCCPLPHAVCCTDGVHCCPQGYRCDTTTGTCSQGLLRIPFS